VIPPKLAPTAVVLVPIWKGDDEKSQVLERANQIVSEWKGNLSFKLDERDNYRPGWKFNEWEKRGVPIRIELGPKDVQSGNAVLVRRDTGQKKVLPQADLLVEITRTLDDIQANLFRRALAFREQNTKIIDDYEQFKQEIEEPGGFFWAHWCGERAAEDRLQEETKATIRCLPLETKPEAGRCMLTGKPSSQRVLIAKAY